MTIETDTVTLPVYWASALVNGDYSGLEDDDAEHCRLTERELADDGWEIVDVARDDEGEAQELRFTWHYRLYDRYASCQGGEVVDYVILKRA